jgi:hypothetical protein
LGSHLAHFRGQEAGSSQASRSVDPESVSCILYHRNRQSSFSRHWPSSREEGLWVADPGSLGRGYRI